MKQSSSILTTLIFLAGIIVFSGNVYSQDSKTADQGKADSKSAGAKEEKLVGTYLDVAHAKSRANIYEQIIKNDIYKLQVVVQNFGDENEKTTLKKIVEEHVNGKKELFKRRYLSAEKIFNSVREQINDLFQNLSEKYQKQANDILGKCAETLVDREIGIGSTRDIDTEVAGKTSRKITQNRIRLLIAYDQLNMAEKFKYDERLSDAITHYRIAKAHGINILIDMADSDADKDKVKNEYKIDQADADLTISK